MQAALASERRDGEAGCEDWEQTLDNIRSDFIGYLPGVTYRKCQDISLKFIG